MHCLKFLFVYAHSFVIAKYTFVVQHPLYESLSAEQKQAELWSRIVDSKHDMSHLPTATYTLDEFLSDFGDVDDLLPLFLLKSDLHPDPKMKFVSTYGTICKMQMEFFQNSTFTGIFQPGTE